MENRAKMRSAGSGSGPYTRFGEVHRVQERWDTRPLKAADLEHATRPAPSHRGKGGCSSPGWVSIQVGSYSNGNPIWQRVPVSCHKCQHCREVRRTAKAHAVHTEVMSADWSFFLTFTIAPAALEEVPLMDKVLDLGHMQRLMKRLRTNARRSVGSFEGVKSEGLRYLQCGELGSRNGRAHYHALLWGWGDPPRFPCDDPTAHIPEWPYGFTFTKAGVDEGHARYVCKYLMKQDAKRGQNFFITGSMKPAIGSVWAYDRGFAVGQECGIGTPPTQSFMVRRVGDLKQRKALLTGANRRWFLRGWMDATGATPEHLFRVLPVEVHGEVRRIVQEDEERALRHVTSEEFLADFSDHISRASAAYFADERARHATALPVGAPDPEWTPERDGADLSLDERATNERLRRKWSRSG